MADYIQISAKTVDEAVTKALIELGITSDKLEYEVVEKGSAGFLGIGSKPAVIKARKKMDIIEEGREFLEKVFQKMHMDVAIDIDFDKEEKVVSINPFRSGNGGAHWQERTDAGFSAASGKSCD